jgi:hypothetical protein
VDLLSHPGAAPGHLRNANRTFLVVLKRRDQLQQVDKDKGRHERMGILWIILIVILVLALLGFFSRGRF